MLDNVRETARRVEAQGRERADRGKRKRPLRLKPGDYVMVARKTRTSTKMEARWTGPHQVLQKMKRWVWRGLAWPPQRWRLLESSCNSRATCLKPATVEC
jgi:hypothetical protein